MKKSDDFLRFGKFLLVGLSNTLLTYLVFILLRLFGVSPEWCNFWGYVVGVINSFVWNKLWVFQTRNTNVWLEMGRFLGVFLFCYVAQLYVFRLLIHSAHINEYYAQLLGMAVYTIMNYFMNKFIAFKR